MTRFLGATIVGMLALFSPLSEADEPADQFVRIYELIQQADALTDSGHTDLARQKYLEAQSELVSLRKAHPGWNDSVVDFRLQYVGGKLGSPAATNSPPAAPVDKAGSPVAKTGAEERVRLLEERVRQLAAEKELLQAKLNEALTAQPAAIDPRELTRAEENLKALQKEVALLKINLEKAEAKPDKPVDPAVLEATRKALLTANQKLAEAAASAQTNAAIAAVLQTALKTAQEEKNALESRNRGLEQALDQIRHNAASLDRDQLRAQLDQSQQEIASLRASIEALEAPAVPYSREELALLTPSEVAPAKGGGEPGASGPRAGSAVATVNAAERAFAARRYAEAEKKFTQALALDANNPVLLANLAAAQIEQNRLAEAEANLRKALTANAGDSFSLSLLGVLKVREQKYDEACTALSRAVQIDPQNVSALQNLGVALAGKGLREPAVSALRRAIALAPGNAAAHYNLAVIYAAGRPPALELARWHYRQAVAGGHGRDSNLEKRLTR